MAEVVVIGAGISGLALAHRLVRAGRDVRVLEASARVGGVIRTDTIDGFLVEGGPNSVRSTDALEALAAEVGLADVMLAADSRAPRYVYSREKLVRAPMGPASLVTTPLLSLRAKLRLLGEPFVGRPRDGAEPSIETFVTRRLGREIHDTLVSAFVSGIYAGDTSKLSAEAVFPQLVEMEREHGGLLRGALAMLRNRKSTPSSSGETPPPKRRGLTIVSFEGGLARLPAAIADGLGDALSSNTAVEAIERTSDGFDVHTAGGERIAARTLVLATGAGPASALLAPIAPRAGELLGAIEYPSLVSVSLAYEGKDVGHSCEGFGFLAPRASGLRTLGAIFPSSLFPGRAPERWHSFTCFVGGATDPRAVELDDEAIVAVVAEDLGRAVRARGTPKVLSVTRWQRAIPQYTIGHIGRIAEVERDVEAAGVRLIGNYLHGVSVGECVAEANRVAATLTVA